MIIRHTSYILIAGQHTDKLRLHRILCAADDMQNASTRDPQAHALSGGNTLQHSPVYRRCRPKHAVSEGLTTLADDKRPEAYLLIGLSQYPLQGHIDLIIWG